MSFVACEAITSEEPIDAAEQYLRRTRIRNKRESKHTIQQGSAICLHSRGKEERDFIDSTINTICTLHNL